ncbi:AmiR/NasT family two-component response regulator [Evansella vedderi]|uniref:AmiR/NasT family two-component response regulator n=1 Tax=Evansella vedderi TaxID=38282 RepID=A0ABT9ZNT4_9BACI|nr:ANTAR domain-containing protein [Evansella vedderi]MDQ0252899.1 AmiR/NasT family two-component response regulator [Evansella vedderi]
MKELYLFMREEQYRQNLADTLHSLGYQVHIPVKEKIETSYYYSNHLCIVDSWFFKRCKTHFPYAILFTKTVGEDEIQLIQTHSCTGFICPIYNERTLQAVIEIALMKQKQFQQIEKDNRKLTRKLQDRRIIEKAKYILVKRGRISEEEAYERMRTEAMNQQKTLRQVADLILINEE